MDCADLLEQTEHEPKASMRRADSVPIPGYRLIQLLGSGGVGEVWKCEAPGGFYKAIKFVYGNLNGLGADGASAEEELRAIQRVKAIRHPFMLSIERVEIIEGELAIVTELADKSLHDVLTEYRQAGKPGIPREELLGYLREAAEALDLLNIQHELQHLDIKPRNLFLVSNHIKVADYGLVSSLSGRHSDGSLKLQLGAITPLYASPEVFHGSLSPRCDQYSLAIVYQELLTGTLPFAGKNSRQLLFMHTIGDPDLSALPEADRPIIAKALAKDPQERFATCTDFVLALATSSFSDSSASRTPSPSANAAGRLELLAGYRFVECIGCSPQAEVWKAVAPGDKKRVVKYLYGLNCSNKNREAEAVARLNAIRYPTLAHFEVGQQGPARLVLVTDWFEKSLWKRLQECQAQGLSGVPRQELLGYLRTAAETLDHLYGQHAVGHLALNPRNLLLDGDRLLVEGFGLMQLLYLPSGQPVPLSQRNYSAPELIDRQVSRSCDQYSLALIYFDLLIGKTAKSAEHRKMPGRAGQGAKRDLGLLPEEDARIIARALSDDPQERWPSATEMVSALAKAVPATEKDTVGNPAAATGPDLTGLQVAPRQASSAGALTPDRIIRGLLASAGNSSAVAMGLNAEQVIPQGDFLLRKFSAPLPIGTARVKLEELAQQCGAKVVEEDEENVVFHVIRPLSFWQQCLGRQPGLELRVHLSRPRTPAATPIDVTVQISPFGCRRKHGLQLLSEMGSLLLESIRTLLQVNSERRLQDRLVWNKTLPVRCVLPDGSLGEVVECHGKDISVNGIGFYLLQSLPTTLITVEVPTNAEPPSVTVQANIVRVQRCGNGWYEVGALFLQNADFLATSA